MITLLALCCALQSTPVADGVLDAEGTNLYLPSKEGGIDVLDAVTGRLKYHHEPSGKPLAVTGNTLVIETIDPKKPHVVQFRVLSLPEGKITLEAKPLELPDWAARDGRGKGIAAAARIEKGTLVYEWKAWSRWVGAVPLIRSYEQRHTKDAAGTARVDLATGEVKSEAASLEREIPPVEPTVTAHRRRYTVVEDRTKIDPGRGGEITRTLKCRPANYGESAWEWPLPSRYEKPLPQ